MEVARGNVSDRPFARTIYTIGAKRFTGDLVLSNGDREYKLSLEDGKVVAAESPEPSDTIGRVALTSGYVTSTALGQFLQAMSAAPDREELDVLAEVARLGRDKVVELKRRFVAQKATRIFALPDASFVINNARSLRADPDVPPLDLRAVIYAGLSAHYSQERLASEMAGFLDKPVKIAPDATGSLRAFGFGSAERSALSKLSAEDLTADELASSIPGLDPRLAYTLIYSLVACDCAAASGRQVARKAPRATASPAQQGSKPAPPGRPIQVENPTKTARATPRRRKRASTMQRRAGNANSAAAKATRELIETKCAMLDRDANHFTLLDVAQSASLDEVRRAYFQLAKRLHPDRLRAVGVSDMEAEAQRLFATINKAFAVLSDSKKRMNYNTVLAAGGEKAVRKKEREAEEMAANIFAAEDHFRIGEMALRRNQFDKALEEFQKAVELNSEEAEHHAMLAWALWCATDDKGSVNTEVDRHMSIAIKTSPRCIPAHFYRAQILKQREDFAKAVSAFRKVVELDPNHNQANLELRVLKSRKSGDTESKGLFGRRRKR